MTPDWERRALRVQFTVTSLQILELTYCLIAVLLGATQAWPFLDRPSSVDVVSYLDIGDAYAQGRWKDALNGYWNPLYSWILGPVMAIVRPSPRYEYAVGKLVDFAIYLITIAAFWWFLRNLRARYRAAIERSQSPRIGIPDWAWIVGGYTLFLWSSIRWIKLTSNSPDMAGAALACAAWAMLLRLEDRGSQGRYALLGIVLALGYFARTPLLLVGVSILPFMLLSRSPVRRRGAVTTSVVLLVLTAPYVAALSLAHRHLTIGESGKLNHAWLANPGEYRIPGVHWQGGPPGYGTPRHPTRLIWSRPRIFEFATPLVGTYPPWLDPSYWEEGLQYHFDSRAERIAATHNVQFYYDLFGKWLLVAAVVLLAGFGAAGSSARALISNVHLWIPNAIGLALYLVALDLVVRDLPPQPHSRYVATFVTLLVLVLAFAFRFRGAALTRVKAWGLAGALAATSVLAVSVLASDVLHELEIERPQPPWHIAERLQRAGISPGARIAVVGHEVQHELWARLARVSIVAQVPEAGEFWRQPQDLREAMLRVIARTGATAVVSAPNRQTLEGWPEGSSEGWIDAPDTGFSVRDLSSFK